MDFIYPYFVTPLSGFYLPLLCHHSVDFIYPYFVTPLSGFYLPCVTSQNYPVLTGFFCVAAQEFCSVATDFFV